MSCIINVKEISIETDYSCLQTEISQTLSSVPQYRCLLLQYCASSLGRLLLSSIV